jgi:hypothetical protein
VTRDAATASPGGRRAALERGAPLGSSKVGGQLPALGGAGGGSAAQRFVDVHEHEHANFEADADADARVSPTDVRHKPVDVAVDLGRQVGELAPGGCG